jgi:hypothetical protein
MTRINLAPVPILLVAYIFWMHGWQIGWKAALSAAVPAIIGHALFWPNIVRHWAYWFPGDSFSFLKPYARPPGSDPTWDPSVTPEAKVMSFLYGLRFHFTALVAALATWLAWPRKDRWKTRGQFTTAIFLSILLVVLVLLHLWATLGKNYCTFCFPIYLSFFSILGPTLLIITVSSWERTIPAWRGVLIGVTILVLGIAIGYSALQILVTRFFRSRFPGCAPCKFCREVWRWGHFYRTWSAGTSVVSTGSNSSPPIGCWIGRWSDAAPGGSFDYKISHQTGRATCSSFGFIALTLLLVSGLILSPTILLGGGFHNYDCSGDVIRSYEIAGIIYHNVSRQIPWYIGMPELQLCPCFISKMCGFSGPNQWNIFFSEGWGSGRPCQIWFLER